METWYSIEVRRPELTQQKRRRRGLLARITGNPGVRSVQDDLAATTSTPTLAPDEALTRGVELFAQFCRVNELEIRKPQLASADGWSLTPGQADKILEKLRLDLIAADLYDGKVVSIRRGMALLRAALAPEGALYCGLSAPGLQVWPEREDMLVVGIDRPQADTVALVERLGLTVQPGQDPHDELHLVEVAPADDAFWAEVTERIDRAGAPLPCGQLWITGVEQWFTVDRANLANVRAQMRPRALITLLDQPLVTPDRELIERHRHELWEALHTRQPYRLFLLRNADDQRIRTIWPILLADFDRWEAAIEDCGLVGAYRYDETGPTDGLIATQPDPDGIARTWRWADIELNNES